MDIATAISRTLERATPRTKVVFGGNQTMTLDEVTAFISEFPVCVISTTSSNGAPHATGTSVVLVGGKLYLGVNRNTVLDRNLRLDRRVALAFIEPLWKRHVFIHGDIRFLESGSNEERRIQDAHRDAHGYEMELFIEGRPEKVFTWKS